MIALVSRSRTTPIVCSPKFWQLPAAFLCSPRSFRPDSIVLPCLSRRAEQFPNFLPDHGRLKPPHTGEESCESVQTRCKQGQHSFEINVKPEVVPLVLQRGWSRERALPPARATAIPSASDTSNCFIDAAFAAKVGYSLQVKEANLTDEM